MHLSEARYRQLVKAFESGAKKKGYCFDRDEITGEYVDAWLREAWNIFFLIDPKELKALK